MHAASCDHDVLVNFHFAFYYHQHLCCFPHKLCTEDPPLPPWNPHFHSQVELIASFSSYDCLALLLNRILVCFYGNTDFQPYKTSGAMFPHCHGAGWGKLHLFSIPCPIERYAYFITLFYPATQPSPWAKITLGLAYFQSFWIGQAVRCFRQCSIAVGEPVGAARLVLHSCLLHQLAREWSWSYTFFK